jgi:hypothetical protein
MSTASYDVAAPAPTVVASLTLTDRCDAPAVVGRRSGRIGRGACGAQGCVRAVLPSGRDLVFCAHHGREHEAALAAAGGPSAIGRARPVGSRPVTGCRPTRGCSASGWSTSRHPRCGRLAAVRIRPGRVRRGVRAHRRGPEGSPAST